MADLVYILFADLDLEGDEAVVVVAEGRLVESEACFAEAFELGLGGEAAFAADHLAAEAALAWPVAGFVTGAVEPEVAAVEGAEPVVGLVA